MLLTKEQIADEVHERILKEWAKKEQDLFFLGPYKDSISLARYHSTLGRYIRNEYKLWERKWTPELNGDEDYSPDHPDNLSFDIMKLIWLKGPKRG